ncbi:MAG: pectate lyase-like adhesive domain-containing protein [Coprococcus sp.]|uniref:pectate lyase-like adhesive domain-containing protein n=1 Tax=Coprococcus sp. TaxID=2049024 RepID=UPI0039962132
MKKRLFSILLALCMVLCLVPTTAFAESETEEPPVCTCETACTAEAMNADCPICGAEGALPENCAKCAQPADDAAVQPEGEVSDPQPETALTSLIGGNETAKDVSTAEELTAAIADVNFDTVRLTGDISISSTLTVNRTVTLDLNGHVLKYESANNGSVIVVEGSGQLTIEDSNTSNLSHKFNPNGKLWVLDDASGTEAVTGGVITGGTGTDISTFGGTTWYCGGGALIKNGGSLTMRGGNIIGCSAECGGGVCIDSEQGQFSMSGGSIAGCVASDIGGGVFASGTFKMSGPAVIRSCTAESATQYVCGGGVYVNVSSSFEMSDTAIIEGCQAISTSSNSSNGGGVYVSSSSSFVMSNEAKIEGCQAISTSSNSSNGGGVHLANNTKFTLSGNAVIQNCTATNSANSGEAYGGGVSAACVKEITLADSARIVGCAAANGSGLYITGSQVPGYGILYANSGSVDGDVVLGDTEDGPSTITGSGGTVFNGKVTVTPGSTIESGTFNGEVTNNGTIKGGTFNGEVINNGTITGGIFNTPMTGSGTETDPYQISTADQLKLFRDKVNDAKTKEETKICAVLTADIDLKNEEWTPIGIGNGTRNGVPIDFPYSGTFDGNGHTISGLNVNYRNKNGGLFCYVMNATIKNLTVAGSVTHSSGDGVAYGGIVGCADSSTIENCTNRCTVTGNWYAGGIVGWSTDSDIIGCANFGNISSPSFSGGICGKIGGENDAAGIDATIRDCYNVGMVSGNYAGGITGQSDSEHIDILIANCYNVGSLHGSTNTGEIIGDLSGPICTTIDNCYYLPTGNPASTSDRVNVKRTDSKTAAEFADGTVLALLKAGERDNNADPWADECQYLAAAGKTLPVFNGQGDAHDHQSNDWEHNDTEHWQVCTCGAVFNKAAHSGGTATCTQRATCTVCGAEYGDALGHDFTTSWTHDDNMHWKQCSRCDKKDDVSPHTWDNGTITIAPTCTKAGEETYSCTKCGATKIEPIPATGHRWKSEWTSDATHHWHECANESCDVTDNAGKNGYAEHSGGKATCKDKAICEICGDSYGSLDPNNHTDLKHIDAKAATVAEEGNIAYWYCDGCKKYFSDAAATKEITKAATVTAKLPPKITAGDGAVVTQGEKKELTFTSDASFADFVRVELDGTALEEKNYTKREGSTIITLNRDFVAALSVGEHTLAIVSQHGTATAKFTVKAKPTETAIPQPTVTPQPTAQPVSSIPRTGDTANPALWFALLIVSGGAAIGITVVSRKKKHNK